MERSRFIRIVVLLVSFTIFSIQMKGSLENLTNPPIVTTEERLSFEDIDPPLISICPVDQIDEEKLKNLGYKDYDSFLLGNARPGTNTNLSFSEILDQALTYSPNNDMELNFVFDKTAYNLSQFKRNFYHRLGYCWEISDYKPVNKLMITYKINSLNISEFRVFLTDKSVVSMPTPDLSTYRGNDISLEIGKDRSYHIELSKVSSFNPTDKDYCKHYANSEFQSCVDHYVVNQINDGLADFLICNPPFLTNTKKCTDMNWKSGNNLTFSDKIVKSLRFYTKFCELEALESFSGEGICKPPCTLLRSNVRKGKKREDDLKNKLTLQFDETIIYSKAVLSYDFSNFLVDLGSAVGLWFGISVLGLTEVGMQVVSVGKIAWEKVKSFSKI